MTFALPENLKKSIRQLAQHDGCTPSEWMRAALRETSRRALSHLRKQQKADA